MKRIIAGWFLFLLMTVFTVTAHSGLRFCLCEKAVILGDCACEQTNLSPPTSPAPSECSCCSSCLKKHNNAPTEHQLSIQCSCMVDLSIPLNDFLIHGSDTAHSENLSKPQAPLIQIQQDFALPSVILARGSYTTRGSPPSLVSTTVPIYIRDSVYRL